MPPPQDGVSFGVECASLKKYCYMEMKTGFMRMEI